MAKAAYRREFSTGIQKHAGACAAIMCAILTQGCASFVPAEPGTPLTDQVETGDQVRVVLVDGGERDFIVTGVDNDGLYDDEIYLRFDDVSEMRISKGAAEESPFDSKAVVSVLDVILLLDALGIGNAD